MLSNNLSELGIILCHIIFILRNDRLTWEVKYDLIFSDSVSLRVFELLPGFHYYDPDTSYQEDVEAFVQALNEYVYNDKNGG